MTRNDDDAERTFRVFYAAHFDPLLAYALRRVDQPADAADVVAETFLIAWRRRGSVPAGDEARLWLFGTARKVLANQRRGGQRRDRLGERLRERLATTVPDGSVAVVEGQAVQQALARLSEPDREVLTLSAWDGLAPQEVAVVLGLPDATVRQRLSRARARLRQHLGEAVPAGSALASEENR